MMAGGRTALAILFWVEDWASTHPGKEAVLGVIVALLGARHGVRKLEDAVVVDGLRLIVEGAAAELGAGKAGDCQWSLVSFFVKRQVAWAICLLTCAVGREDGAVVVRKKAFGVEAAETVTSHTLNPARGVNLDVALPTKPLASTNGGQETDDQGCGEKANHIGLNKISC